jgi:hypothetical protein
MATGACTTCGYSPVAIDARVCPKCGAANPNPGVGNRFGGRGALLGLVIGIVAGGALGYDRLTHGAAGAFGGALLGSLAGLLLGLVLGFLAAAVAWISGKR